MVSAQQHLGNLEAAVLAGSRVLGVFEGPAGAAERVFLAAGFVAEDARHVMVVCDADGVLLWREGSTAVRRRADALGFTDAERLTKMAEVFDAVSTDGQVIILTCSPQRYAGVRCAQHIALTA